MSERLRELDFLAAYDKTDHDIAATFYVPCMERALRYDRITGFFSSGVYLLAWPALKSFIARPGRIRLICSPFMTRSDIASLEEGYDALSDLAIAERLNKEIDELLSQPQLRRPARMFAWLVANGLMEVKVARLRPTASPSDKRMFHDKVGVFTDAQGDAVGFRGTMNETFLGLAADGNLESIDVFPSWVGGRDEERLIGAVSRFTELWEGDVNGVDVSGLPEQTRQRLVEASDTVAPELLIDEILSEMTVAQGLAAGDPTGGSTGATSPTLRRHQVDVLASWRAAGHRGIIEHATGSGKTRTALSAVRSWMSEGVRPGLVLVPSVLLVDQWRQAAAEHLGDKWGLLVAGAGARDWARPGVLRRWMRPEAGQQRLVIATYQTAATDTFINLMGKPPGLLLVADEVHRSGSPRSRRIFDLDAEARLGLSATPTRYGDPDGTAEIMRYFGPVLEPRYQLSDAIRDQVLTPYTYTPHVVRLTDTEQRDWSRFTADIRQRYARLKASQEDPAQDDRLKLLMMQRSRVLKAAANKTELAVEIVKEGFVRGAQWLIYCDNQDQLRDVRAALARAGQSSMEYHSVMQGDREATLTAFEVHGGILVAIRSLDEGVDIPSMTHAVILASSRNPREFIQRRGRVLRRSPGKWFAHVHDALVLPDVDDAQSDDSPRVAWAELARAIEFGRWANNPQCITELERICMDHGIDFRDLLEIGEESDDDE